LVERLAVRSPGLPIFTESRPYTYADAEAFVQCIEKRVKAGELRLAPGEAHDLAALRRELELDGAEADPHALSLTDGGDRLLLDLYGTQELFMTGEALRDSLDLTTSTTTIGGRMRLTLMGRLAVAADVRNTRLQGSSGRSVFTARQGPPSTKAGENGEFQDAADAYVALRTPIADLQVGKSPLAWGPGRSGSLLLGADAYSFDHFRLTRAFGPLRYVALYGWLRGEQEPRYIAAHRIEARIHPRLTLGGGEAVVYGQGNPRQGERERGFQLEYLLPLFPIHVGEHYLGDYDNNLMSMDARWIPLNGWELWGELLIDDFNTSRAWDHFGNKLGYLAGSRVVLGNGMDASVEYVRLDPWVYTHRVEGNSYTHFDHSLGHWLVPNSDLIGGDLGWRPLGSLAFRFSWKFTRNSVGHTANGVSGYFVGDDQRLDPGNPDSPKRAFTGVLERTRELRARVEWEPRYECLLSASVGQLAIDNFDHVAGNDLDDLEFSLGVRIEY
jgi:hypothetical protein